MIAIPFFVTCLTVKFLMCCVKNMYVAQGTLRGMMTENNSFTIMRTDLKIMAVVAGFQLRFRRYCQEKGKAVLVL
jgi:hypothetical protein